MTDDPHVRPMNGDETRAIYTMPDGTTRTAIVSSTPLPTAAEVRAAIDAAYEENLRDPLRYFSSPEEPR